MNRGCFTINNRFEDHSAVLVWTKLYCERLSSLWLILYVEILHLHFEYGVERLVGLGILEVKDSTLGCVEKFVESVRLPERTHFVHTFGSLDHLRVLKLTLVS